MTTIGNSPVSATTAGAGIGLTIGSIVPGVGSAVGYGVGAAIGAVVDLFGKADELKKARQRLEQAFYAALIKRYNNQVFASCLEILGSSMQYAQTLGLKPGTTEFEALLQKKMSKGTCIYSPPEATGACGITLYRLDPNSGSTVAVATVTPGGLLQSYDSNVDLSLGTKWREACHEMQLAALQAWANNLKDNMIFDKALQEAKDEELRNTATRIMVNAGLLSLMFGYILRQKIKIKKYRDVKQKRKISSPKP